ncbi:MAG: hypothetical protein Q8929_08890, partial [Bacillota bacterium]|nr:hypothetical protein [Bacillota bacterium]
MTPAGVRGWGDPTGAYGAEEAHLYPGGKQVPGAEINSLIEHSFAFKCKRHPERGCTVFDRFLKNTFILVVFLKSP